MTTSIIWHGADLLEDAFTAQIERARGRASSAVLAAAHAVEAHMKLRAGEGGRHAKGTPTPASPGGGPAVISGTLRRSIMVEGPSSWGLAGFSARIGPTVIYGRRIELEYGYPYAAPGLRDALPEIAAIFAREWAN